jgi:hypothetical protein
MAPRGHALGELFLFANFDPRQSIRLVLLNDHGYEKFLFLIPNYSIGNYDFTGTGPGPTERFGQTAKACGHV